MRINATKKEKIRVAGKIPPCGLCGERRKQRQLSDCCSNWVCGNEGDCTMFSYSRDICVRNHRRFTLCAFHHAEKHGGDWKTCGVCLKSFDAEIYAWYGTNRYNFEKLQHVPTFTPRHCNACGRVLSAANGGFTNFPSGGIACEDCCRTAPDKGEYASGAPRQAFGVGCVVNPDARRRSAAGAHVDVTDATQSVFDKFFRWFNAQLADDLHLEGTAAYGNVIDWAGLEKIYSSW